MPDPLERSRFNGWITKNRLIPYEYACLISKVAKIPLELLYSFDVSKDDKEEKDLGLKKKTLISWSIQRIIVPADFYDPITTVVDTCIIVDAEGVLIYGLSMLRWYQDQGKEEIQVIVVDWHAIQAETSFLESFDFTFSISQQSAMSVAFKKSAPKRQGLRCDLLEKKASELKKIEKGSELRSPAYEMRAQMDASQVAQGRPFSDQAQQGRGPKNSEKGSELRSLACGLKGRTDEWLAKIFGFTSKDLLVRAQKLYDHAPEWLILAVDKGQVPITKAFRMLNKPEALEACKQGLPAVIPTPSLFSKSFENLEKSEKTRVKKECHDEALC